MRVLSTLIQNLNNPKNKYDDDLKAKIAFDQNFVEKKTLFRTEIKGEELWIF